MVFNWLPKGLVPSSSKSSSSSKPADKKKPKDKKDYTWGGRPDPTPELYVDDSADFWAFAKKIGKK
jgi:hypothetical protein